MVSSSCWVPVTAGSPSQFGATAGPLRVKTAELPPHSCLCIRHWVTPGATYLETQRMESWETRSTEAKFTHYRHHSTQTQRYDEAVLEQDRIRSQGPGPHCHRTPQGGGPREAPRQKPHWNGAVQPALWGACGHGCRKASGPLGSSQTSGRACIRGCVDNA